jgi:hypothetical protein
MMKRDFIKKNIFEIYTKKSAVLHGMVGTANFCSASSLSLSLPQKQNAQTGN